MDDLFFNSFKFKLVGFSVGFYIVFCVRTLWSIYCNSVCVITNAVFRHFSYIGRNVDFCNGRALIKTYSLISSRLPDSIVTFLTPEPWKVKRPRSVTEPGTVTSSSEVQRKNTLLPNVLRFLESVTDLRFAHDWKA